jgi:hypothetical protein
MQRRQEVYQRSTSEGPEAIRARDRMALLPQWLRAFLQDPSVYPF